jgi:hypothetical protein
VEISQWESVWERMEVHVYVLKRKRKRLLGRCIPYMDTLHSANWYLLASKSPITLTWGEERKWGEGEGWKWGGGEGEWGEDIEEKDEVIEDEAFFENYILTSRVISARYLPCIWFSVFRNISLNLLWPKILKV